MSNEVALLLILWEFIYQKIIHLVYKIVQLNILFLPASVHNPKQTFYKIQGLSETSVSWFHRFVSTVEFYIQEMQTNYRKQPFPFPLFGLQFAYTSFTEMKWMSYFLEIWPSITNKSLLICQRL